MSEPSAPDGTPVLGQTSSSQPSAPKQPAGYAVFVAHDTYRQRRMVDAAGLLPTLGAVLFALPLLWLGQAGDAARTSYVMIYVFAVWAGLVILSALITRSLRASPDASEDDAPAADHDPRGG
ncbi:hypothetical protein ACEWPM_012905 [Roseovarius sp. S4756]|uniref:hypothetical protein n=1 Tax=Roseovarius maritimus TaxID=3342637 RepID=UPI0037275D44